MPYTIILLPCAGGFPHPILVQKLTSLYNSIPIISVFQSKTKATIGLHQADPNEHEIKDAVIQLINKGDAEMQYILSGWSMGGRIACDIACNTSRILAIMLQAPTIPKESINRYTQLQNLNILILHNIKDRVVSYVSTVALSEALSNCKTNLYDGTDEHFVSERIDDGIDFIISAIKEDEKKSNEDSEEEESDEEESDEEESDEEDSDEEEENSDDEDSD
jgi:dienelactone hydrolase